MWASRCKLFRPASPVRRDPHRYSRRTSPQRIRGTEPRKPGTNLSTGNLLREGLIAAEDNGDTVPQQHPPGVRQNGRRDKRPSRQKAVSSTSGSRSQSRFCCSGGTRIDHPQHSVVDPQKGCLEKAPRAPSDHAGRNWSPKWTNSSAGSATWNWSACSAASLPFGSLGGEWRLPPPRLVHDLDPVHPLDPPESPPAGRDQSCRSAVAVRQRQPADVGGQEQEPGVPGG